MVAEKAESIIQLPRYYEPFSGIVVAKPRKEMDSGFGLWLESILANIKDSDEVGYRVGLRMMVRMTSLEMLRSANESLKMGSQLIFTMYQQQMRQQGGVECQVAGEYRINMDDKRGEGVRMSNDLGLVKDMLQDRRYKDILKYASHLVKLK